MLQTLQLMPGDGYLPNFGRLPEHATESGKMLTVPTGTFVMGTDDRTLALDNERGEHEVYLEEFRIGQTPVTNDEYREFVEDGGYRREEFWNSAGWDWLQSEDIQTPKHWYQSEPHSWWTECFGFDDPLRPNAPVVHVCWYEADAYARYRGKRLPAEAEWEKQPPGTQIKVSRGFFPGVINHLLATGPTSISSRFGLRVWERIQRERAHTG